MSAKNNENRKNRKIEKTFLKLQKEGKVEEYEKEMQIKFIEEMKIEENKRMKRWLVIYFIVFFASILIASHFETELYMYLNYIGYGQLGISVIIISAIGKGNAGLNYNPMTVGMGVGVINEYNRQRGRLFTQFLYPSIGIITGILFLLISYLIYHL